MFDQQTSAVGTCVEHSLASVSGLFECFTDFSVCVGPHEFDATTAPVTRQSFGELNLNARARGGDTNKLKGDSFLDIRPGQVTASQTVKGSAKKTIPPTYYG